MIDVHSHIIPQIDDGSASFEESYDMFLEATNAGFTDIITTSHYIEDYYEVDHIKRYAWVVAMNNVLKEHDIDLNLHCGNEIYITKNLIKLIKEKKASTLADSKYVLFELPMNNNIVYLNEIIFEIKSLGLMPVIAHPERYLYVQQNPNMLIDLIKQGVLFQGNFASVIGKYGNHAKNTIKQLLKANMIHFLGTDCHRSNDIYSKMSEIIRELKKILGDAKFEELTEVNPSHIIKNEEFDISEPIKIKTGLFN